MSFVEESAVIEVFGTELIFFNDFGTMNGKKYTNGTQKEGFGTA